MTHSDLGCATFRRINSFRPEKQASKDLAQLNDLIHLNFTIARAYNSYCCITEHTVITTV